MTPITDPKLPPYFVTRKTRPAPPLPPPPSELFLDVVVAPLDAALRIIGPVIGMLFR